MEGTSRRFRSRSEIPEQPERRGCAARRSVQNSTEKHLPVRPTQKPQSPARILLQPQEGGSRRIPAIAARSVEFSMVRSNSVYSSR